SAPPTACAGEPALGTPPSASACGSKPSTRAPAATRSPAIVAPASPSPSTATLSTLFAPDLLRRLHHQPHLGGLLVAGELVARNRGGEAALRREAELVHVHELRRLLDAPLEHVLVLELRALRRHEPEHHHLALGHEAQRLERPGALVVVLEEEAVHRE